MAREPHGHAQRKTARDNVVQLRRDIDAGRTGGKVRVEDPATAPLGTDDEAAGAPPSADAVRTARAQGRRGVPASPEGSRLRNGLGVVAALAVLAVLMAAAATLLLLP